MSHNGLKSEETAVHICVTDMAAMFPVWVMGQMVGSLMGNGVVLVS